MKNKAALPTSAEITRRLQTVSELRSLCLNLGRAKRLDVNATEHKKRVANHPPDAWVEQTSTDQAFGNCLVKRRDHPLYDGTPEEQRNGTLA